VSFAFENTLQHAVLDIRLDNVASETRLTLRATEGSVNTGMETPEPSTANWKISNFKNLPGE
jgi:hypothetical protein